MTRWIEETFHPHTRIRLAADKVLHEARTRHQHLVIFTNATWGTVLMLDGVCQLTTADEFIYHEMLAHVPLMALERPRRVLVVGGGDGGVLREVLKHPSVEKATLCEIDRAVIDLSLKHYPEVADGAYDDPRTDVVIADGVKHVAETRDRVDAIIVDSSEPVGPSAALRTPAFFADCKRALKAGGVLVARSGLPFLAHGQLPETSAALGALFNATSPYLCTRPCSLGGPLARICASDDKDLLEVPAGTLARRMSRRAIAPRYYTPAVHRAAFVLPAFVRRASGAGPRAPAPHDADADIAARAYGTRQG